MSTSGVQEVYFSHFSENSMLHLPPAHPWKSQSDSKHNSERVICTTIAQRREKILTINFRNKSDRNLQAEVMLAGFPQCIGWTIKSLSPVRETLQNYYNPKTEVLGTGAWTPCERKTATETEALTSKDTNHLDCLTVHSISINFKPSHNGERDNSLPKTTAA